MNLEEYMKATLDEFDRFDLNQAYTRRVAVKPLYDFFQKLVIEMGVKNCHLLKGTLNPMALSSRWNLLKDYLKDTDRWDEIINRLQNMRNDTNHKDDYCPEKKNLQSIRQIVPEFRTWILLAATDYREQSEGLPFIDMYRRYSLIYIRRSSHIPSLALEQELFSKRLSEIEGFHDLTGEDFIQLINFVREVERYDQREFTCLRCGGRLEEYFESSECTTGSHFSGDLIRVIACDSCDYVKSREKS